MEKSEGKGGENGYRKLWVILKALKRRDLSTRIPGKGENRSGGGREWEKIRVVFAYRLTREPMSGGDALLRIKRNQKTR